MTLHIELQSFAGCPHLAPTQALLREVTRALCPSAQISEIDVASPEQAAALGFLGSPSIRVEGRDLEGRPPASDASLCCRVYGAKGVPPRWMVEAAILRALPCRSYLFLCVANSARSQMAEGLARSLAPRGVRVASAGSTPATVRPEAVQVLAEQGIDISGQRSKSVDSIPPHSVDAVVTLCAEEVCPAFLGQAHRVHWGLPDPAAITADTQDRLAAFRQVRDVLQRRLVLLLGQ